MADQLTIFGLWERVLPEPLPEPPPPPPPTEPAPIDPRQADLLAGPQTLRNALQDACAALDAEVLRRSHADLARKFTGQTWADKAPLWADQIDWLLGSTDAPISVEEQIDRAFALRDDSVARARFAELSTPLLERVRAGALRRAAERAIAEHGITARLADGRPVGYLLLLANEFKLAQSSLSAAAAATENRDARLLGYLGEAAWRAGDPHESLRAFCLACLVDPAALDPDLLTATPFLDLIDEAEDRELPEPTLAHIPVLADLLGKHPLDDHALHAPSVDAPASRRLAASLRAYRKRRASRDLDEPARIEAKREMVRLAAPGLRELLRKL